MVAKGRCDITGIWPQLTLLILPDNHSDLTIYGTPSNAPLHRLVRVHPLGPGTLCPYHDGMTSPAFLIRACTSRDKNTLPIPVSNSATCHIAKKQQKHHLQHPYQHRRNEMHDGSCDDHGRLASCLPLS